MGKVKLDQNAITRGLALMSNLSRNEQKKMKPTPFWKGRVLPPYDNKLIFLLAKRPYAYYCILQIVSVSQSSQPQSSFGKMLYITGKFVWV